MITKDALVRCAHRVSNKEEFVKKAKSVHGNKYDYSLVLYNSTIDKVSIKCPKHNIVFRQIPNSHLRGSGCPKCGRYNTTLKNRMTQEEFIRRSTAMHKNKYNYSLVKYENGKTEIDIICPKHGIFRQCPEGHLSGHGCKKCAFELVHYNQMTTSTFIEKAKKVYKDRYDYSLVDYKKSNIKVKIICANHGLFEVTPNNHLRSMGGCSKCAIGERANKRRLNIQEYVDKATKQHGNKYDYSQVCYKGNNKKIKIICSVHGPYLQSPYAHLAGKGCPLCGRWSLLNTNIFKERSEKAHGKKFDYSLVGYKNSRTKVKIKCLKHNHIFEQTPQNHMKGQGCPICLESQGEKRICSYLDARKIIYKREKTFKECRDKGLLYFDFYLPDYKTCIEFDGLQHYQPIEYFGGEVVFEKTKKSDFLKNSFCKKIGINLIRISYKIKSSEIDFILNKEIPKMELVV